MRNIPKSKLDKAMKDFEKQINAKICSNCKMGNYKQHHEKPHLWLKCGICGHTKSKRPKKKS
jgi:ribosomal protein S27AE